MAVQPLMTAEANAGDVVAIVVRDLFPIRDRYEYP